MWLEKWISCATHLSDHNCNFGRRRSSLKIDFQQCQFLSFTQIANSREINKQGHNAIFCICYTIIYENNTINYGCANKKKNVKMVI